MKAAAFFPDTYAGAVIWTPVPGRPVRLRDQDVGALLDIFTNAGAADAFSELHAAYVRIGGVPFANSNNGKVRLP